MGQPAKNEVGNIYGLLTVVSAGPKKGRHAGWLCKCSCGNSELVHCSGAELRGGGRKSCGCANQSRVIDLTGKIFGRLTVLRRGPNIGQTPGWSCSCDCGNPEPILLRADQLKKGIPGDCGCSKDPYGKGIYGPFLSRAQSKEKGLKQYFLGTSCKQGHVAPRVTSGGECMECKRIASAKKRAEGYFLEYEAKRRETDPNWKANKARVARESYQRHKDDEGAKEKRKAWYEQYKNADWYKSASKRAKAKFVASGKKAEADRHYSKSDSGKASHDKARKQWKEKFEAEKGMPFSSWRLQNDPQFKLHVRLNGRISDALKKQGVIKAAKTAELIDAEIADFKAYLSSNWEEGMSWDNYGRDGWHVDHIRPCASFDLTDEEQQLVCFNWRNLRPMWGTDNISKSDNYDPADEEDWAYMMRELGFSGQLFLIFEEGNGCL